MFYFLLFAHFLADYPLQTNWIVANKNRSGVLFLHIFSQFFVSLIPILIYAPEVWFFAVLLALIHFLIDMGKSYLNRIKPNWVIAPYFIDQTIHFISIAAIAVLIGKFSDIPPFDLKPIWLIALIAYLVVTYVWYISERIISFHDPLYFQQVVDNYWSRMFARATFLSLALLVSSSFSNPAVMMLGLIKFPYRFQTFGTRALLTDIVIAIAGAIFILRVVYV